MHIENERVCHTISRLKHGIRRTPTPFESQKNTWKGVYVMWSGEIFFRNFSPPNIPGLKGGGI